MQGKIIYKPNYQRDYYKLSKSLLKEDLLEEIPDLSSKALLIYHPDSLSFLQVNTGNVKKQPPEVLYAKKSS